MKIASQILSGLHQAKGDEVDYIELLNDELKSIKGIETKVFRYPDPDKLRDEKFEIIITYKDNKNRPLFSGTYTYDGIGIGTVYFVDNVRHLFNGSINFKFREYDTKSAAESLIRYTKNNRGLKGIIAEFDKISDARKALEDFKKFDIRAFTN